MPLPASGKIVVEKPTPTSNTTTVAAIASQQQKYQQLLQSTTPKKAQPITEVQYFEYFDASDRQQQQQQTVVVESNSNNTAKQQQRTPHQRSNSDCNNSFSVAAKSNPTTTTIHQLNLKQQSMHQQQQQKPIIQHTNATVNHRHQQHHHQQQHTVQPLQHAQPLQQQQQQQQQLSQQRLIQVSEEFIEQATAAAAAAGGSGKIMISTAGEVLNQQIFKIVAPDGTTGNMIIDSLGNVTTTTNSGNVTNAHTSNSSKVLLSNLTVLSKQAPTTATVGGQVQLQQQQQQPQTINFVSTKNLSYLTSATSVASVGTSAANGKHQKFSVAGTYKAGTGTGKQQLTTTTFVQQQQHIPSQQNQQQQPQQQQPHHQQQQPHHQPQQHIVQKITVPRNVQMVTRVQTLLPATAGGTSTIAHQLPQQQQQQPQMLLQPSQKYINNTNNIANAISTKASNIIKKSSTLKMAQKMMTNSSNTSMLQQQAIKPFITQQQQQPLLQQANYQTGSNNSKLKSKSVKQYNNTISNNTGTMSIATLPQQQQAPLTVTNNSSSAYMYNHKVGGGHQPQQGTTKITKLSNNKYLMQNHQQQQPIQNVPNLPQGTQLHHKGQNLTNCPNNIILQQQVIGSNTGNSNIQSAGTIKFVNAHGTVIQQHQTQSPTVHQSSKSTTHRQQQQQPLHFVEATAITNDSGAGSTVGGSNNLYQFSVATSQQHQQYMATSGASSSQAQLVNDDSMVVNGAQGTDEAARILQSMAQKSFSNQRYQQQQQKAVVASNMPPPSQQHQQQQPQQQQQPTQIVLQHTSTNASSANGNNILLSPKEYPLYSAVPHQPHQPQQQQQQLSTTGQYVPQSAYLSYSSAAAVITAPPPYTVASLPSSGALGSRQALSTPGSRSQSMERKLHETSITRKSSEYFKVNNATNNTTSNVNSGRTTGYSASNIASSGQVTVTPSLPEQTQVIHLPTTKSMLGAGNSNGNYAAATSIGIAMMTNSNSNEEDIIGEEVRPVPVNTPDLHLQVLHAVLQDHTYANAMPTRFPSDLSAQQLQGAEQPIPTTASAPQSPAIAAGSNATPTQQWSLGGIGAAVASVGHTAAKATTANLSSSATTVLQSSFTLYGQQIPRSQQDDDAHSAISNGSRVASGDIDPGEETETAPEGEADDDSVTRCICDLTHDDGYMICCDKCFAWQHVDCMGIDRQNIPDDYLCELCQPRVVDKAHARSLQLRKRKEQNAQMLLTTQPNVTGGAAGSAIVGGFGGVVVGGSSDLLANEVAIPQQRLIGAAAGSYNYSGADGALKTLSAVALAGNTLPTGKKGKVLKKTKESGSVTGGKKSKKADKLGAGTGAALGVAGGKTPRKETKKSTKRKTKSGDSASTTVTAAEKHAANLRQWIENYELAMTNHYSPELRARLHAITKQPSLLQSILNTENKALKDCGSLESKATTVPHAGGKILISNLDIEPNCPIFELRGKYMLTTQYKTQNASVHMNTPPPSNYHLASYKAHKIPGPFIFFYQLPGAEAPMQTMKPDGTYPPLPPQPAYLKGPEICVDTRTYGNEARFVRRSCRPNAEIQHLFEKGTIHLFIVSLTHIQASTEITIRHEPHDFQAVTQKKANFMVQPTSTACACDLLKDCIFGPPVQQPAPCIQKSNRKASSSIAFNSNNKALNSSAAMQLTMGGLSVVANCSNNSKKKSQTINRNRSTSSSGDSNMGGGLNSPNVIQMNLNAGCNIINNNSGNSLLPLATAGCSNTSNASSSLISVMHDSGICTSSSSPSVSIPSPTSHLHSPTQQHQQLQTLLPVAHSTIHPSSQQESQQQLLQQPQQLQPSHEQHGLIEQPNLHHQQLLASLPSPMLLSPQQQQQQIALMSIKQKQEQQHQQGLPALAVIAAAAVAQTLVDAPSSPTVKLQEISTDQPQKHYPPPQLPQEIHVQLPTTPQEQPKPMLKSPIQQPQQYQQQQQQQELPDYGNDTTLVVAALQALNSCTASCNSSNSSVPTTPTEIEQQQPLFVATATATATNILQSSATVDLLTPQQQTPVKAAHKITPTAPLKSSQKMSNNSVNTSQSAAHNSASSGGPNNSRKSAAAKHTRSSNSTSEDACYDHHNDSTGHAPSSASAVAASSLSTSTPKEKPKMSREDRKMEAILRAIEKMERNQQRNQQRKNEVKQVKSVSKQRNSNSPVSPSKRAANSSTEVESGSTAGNLSAKKNSIATNRKKKRKSQKSYSMHSTQRKRRKSCVITNEFELYTDVDADTDAAVTSEPETTSILNTAGSTVTVMASSVDSTATAASTTTNADQAAGLLMAFAANPSNMSPTAAVGPQQQHSMLSTTTPPIATPSTHYEQQFTDASFKSPQRLQAATNESAASPPPTPPAPVSSACLLIEAAVGPLEHIENSSHNDMSAESEFKYPAKTKTKKVLMSTWLHESETSGSESNFVSPASACLPALLTLPTLSTPTTLALTPASTEATVAQPTASVSLGLGLDTLVQAAMCDYKQEDQQPSPAMPDAEDNSTGIAGESQNLSMAAKQVEEFIHQTERNVTNSASAYEAETVGNSVEQQVQLPLYGRTYAHAASQSACGYMEHTDVVAQSTAMTAHTHTAVRNLQLPLQVSTCSNNSSVKKRWLRQAISEETDENSLTPSAATTLTTPCTPSPTMQLHSGFGVMPANNPPNGFSTPLKKRRLLLSNSSSNSDGNNDNKHEDEDINSGPGASSPSTLAEECDGRNTIVKTEPACSSASGSNSPLASGDDVDVVGDVKCEAADGLDTEAEILGASRTTKSVYQMQSPSQSQQSPPQLAGETVCTHKDVYSPKPDLELKQLVDVHSTIEQQSGEGLMKHDVARSQEFDQDDDVDILRSPSPGQKMVAEDNLVKIEPEDTNSTEDVKIDVEREESLAGDKFEEMVMRVRKEEELCCKIETNKAAMADVKNIGPKEEEDTAKFVPTVVATSCSSPTSGYLKMEAALSNIYANVIKKEEHHAFDNEIKPNATKNDDIKSHSITSTAERKSLLKIEEPPQKKLKLETSLLKPMYNKNIASKANLKSASVFTTSSPSCTNGTSLLAAAAAVAALALPPPPPPPSPPSPISAISSLQVSSLTVITGTVASTVVSTTTACATAAADSSTFNINTNNCITSSSASASGSVSSSSIISSSVQHIKHNNEHKNLSDDDIQECLRSFHKENILFLQSRNKKSKMSSNSSSASASDFKSKGEHKSHSDKSATPHSKHKSYGSFNSSSPSAKKLNKKERRNSISVSKSSSKLNSMVGGSSSGGSHAGSHFVSAATPTSTTSFCAAHNSTSPSSCSSKKLKSLKKSSLSSSNTSSSLSFHSAHGFSANADKEKEREKEKDIEREREKDKEKQRNRSTSGSSNSSMSTSAGAANISTKKRQLNFEQELSKDIHLTSKHRKEGRYDSSSGNYRKRRESMCVTREEFRNSIGRNMHIGNSFNSSSSSSSNKYKSPTGNSNIGKRSIENATNNKTFGGNSTTGAASTNNVPSTYSNINSIATVYGNSNATAQMVGAAVNANNSCRPAESPPVTSVYLREHPTIPHFNNLPQLNSLVATPIVPNNFCTPPPNLLKTLPVPLPAAAIATAHTIPPPPSLPAMAPPPTAAITSIVGANANTPSNVPGATNNLPYYNTIYGKLIDSPQPHHLPTHLQSPLQAQSLSPLTVAPTTAQLATVSSPLPCNSSVSVLPSATTSSSLSDYLDTKVKSFSTLGGYSFGVNAGTKAAGCVGDGHMSPALTANSISVVGNNNTHEIPSSTTPALSGKLPTPHKILTKTASHDPRLNPILSAPEPPPAPKRKLSINEYRKRMRQSTESHSSAATTPTTPDASCQGATSFKHYTHTTHSSYTATINKCSLNSPEQYRSSLAVTKTKMVSTTNALRRSSDEDNKSDVIAKPAENDKRKGQFNAAPTLLEKQQEKLHERLKSLKSKTFTADLMTRRLSTSSLSTEFVLRKESDLFLNHNNNSTASNLDNCLEAISSGSTSLASSRESSPERCFHKKKPVPNATSHKLKHNNNNAFTTSATATVIDTVMVAATTTAAPATEQELLTEIKKTSMAAVDSDVSDLSA